MDVTRRCSGSFCSVLEIFQGFRRGLGFSSEGVLLT